MLKLQTVTFKGSCATIVRGCDHKILFCAFFKIVLEQYLTLDSEKQQFWFLNFVLD